jgi:phosphatidylinositol-3,4,5-trisphosphate 3-phosphatase/dual-specificity protein phosphatase PTEN
MAMGFPAIGCESLYRNSIIDVKKLFNKYHKNKVKVYNLCIEPDRIYNKDIFGGVEVGLFPFADHQASPVKYLAYNLD